MSTITAQGPSRWSLYCKAVSSDGRRCSLYLDHKGGHKPKHGTENDRWEDGE